MAKIQIHTDTYNWNAYYIPLLIHGHTTVITISRPFPLLLALLLPPFCFVGATITGNPERDAASRQCTRKRCPAKVWPWWLPRCRWKWAASTTAPRPMQIPRSSRRPSQLKLTVSCAIHFGGYPPATLYILYILYFRKLHSSFEMLMKIWVCWQWLLLSLLRLLSLQVLLFCFRCALVSFGP